MHILGVLKKFTEKGPDVFKKWIGNTFKEHNAYKALRTGVGVDWALRKRPVPLLPFRSIRILIFNGKVKHLSQCRPNPLSKHCVECALLTPPIPLPEKRITSTVQCKQLPGAIITSPPQFRHRPFPPAVHLSTVLSWWSFPWRAEWGQGGESAKPGMGSTAPEGQGLSGREGWSSNNVWGVSVQLISPCEPCLPLAWKIRSARISFPSALMFLCRYSRHVRKIIFFSLPASSV